MRCFRVLHNFEAQDAVELTVKKGETVVALDGDVQSGWIKVEALNDPSRRGFVPLNYLRETAGTAGPSPASTARDGDGPSVSSRRSRSGEQREGRAQQTTKTAASAAAAGAQSLESDNDAGPSLLENPNVIIEAFMKNELHFKQLVRQRQDALAQMRSTVKEAIADVVACKEKNATLARKLRDLDQAVDKERKRWKERVEEEKAYLQRSMPRE